MAGSRRGGGAGAGLACSLWLAACFGGGGGGGDVGALRDDAGSSTGARTVDAAAGEAGRAGGGDAGASRTDGGATSRDAGPSAGGAPDAARADAALARDAATAGTGGGSDAAVADAGAGRDAAGPACAHSNVLFLIDESASMEEAWGSSSKRQVARGAVEAAVGAQATRLTAAALFFPSVPCISVPPMGGSITPLSDPSQIDFRSGAEFLASWAAHNQAVSTAARIGTPLQEAFDRANVGLEAATLSGTTRVVLITDGEGNCFSDATLTGIPTMLEAQWANQWAQAGIETWVVALPGAAGAQSLQDISNAAGTTTIVPDDEAALRASLEALFTSPCP